MFIIHGSLTLWNRFICFFVGFLVQLRSYYKFSNPRAVLFLGVCWYPLCPCNSGVRLYFRHVYEWGIVFWFEVRLYFFLFGLFSYLIIASYVILSACRLYWLDVYYAPLKSYCALCSNGFLSPCRSLFLFVFIHIVQYMDFVL